MKILVLDTETTIYQKGNPFSKQNKLVLAGIQFNDRLEIFTESFISRLQDFLQEDTLLVTFNSKFDIHWCRRYGIDFSKIKLWDCQLAEFLLNFQKTPYPSLDQAAEKYGLPKKLDIVKTMYWENGINTDEIPLDVLGEYLLQDVSLTYSVYLKQCEEFKKYPQMFKLFRLQCADSMVLEEMEWNGLLLNLDEISKQEKILEEEIQKLESSLKEDCGNIPINFDSTEHVSAYLYGGKITEKVRVPVGVYKTGEKAGQPRNKIISYEYYFDQKVAPLKGSALQKEGCYSTDEPTLRSLKANKRVKQLIDFLLRRSGYFKLLSTYIRGIPSLIETMDWEVGRIFGQYNQCVARTGRLASKAPNQQNFPIEFKKMIISRYAD